MSTTIEPGDSLQIHLRFTPEQEGSRTGTLSIVTNDLNSPHVIPLSGMGVAEGENPDPDPDPDPDSELTYLTADGGMLRDKKGEGDIFVLRSINWYGFEQIGIPGGAWTRPFRTKTVGGVVMEGMLDEIKRLGFNSLRILFSEDSTWPGYKPETRFGYWNTTFISTEMNPEFLNSTTAQNPQDVKPTIEIMDLFVDWCEELGLRIIFDLHCLAPDNDNVLGTNGKWYTTDTPTAPGSTTGARREPRNEQQAIDAHVFLANRYKGRPVVAGFDLINEPHRCTWDRHPLTGVVGFYERCGKAIHAVNPDVLIICEGVSELGMNDGNVDHTPVGHENDEASLQGKYKWGVIWSGKLDEVARINTMPVTLDIPNKIVYSPHEYGSWPGSPAGHQWFFPEEYVGPTYAGLPFPENMPDVWSRQWGYLAEQNIAPLWIGEFGSYLRVGGDPVGGGGASYDAQHLSFDQAWLAKLADYCNENHIGFAFWAWNPGGDPDGLVGQEPAGTWHGAQGFKVDALEPFLPGTETSPGSMIAISPSSLNFGTVTLNQGKAMELVLANPSSGPVTGTATATTGLMVNPTSFTVPAGGTRTITVTMTPTTIGTKTGTVTFDLQGTIKTVPTTGVGSEEEIPVGPDIQLPANAVGIVTIGDSITWGGFYENNGWCSQACFQYDQLYRYRGTHAVIGSTSDQSLNDQLPLVLAMNPPPKACVIATGTNNIYQVTQGTNDVKAICDILVEHNIYPILWTVPPRNDRQDSDNDILAWNTIIRAYAQANGLGVVDAFEAMRVPGTNRLQADYDFGDGLHLSTYAYGQLGKWVVDNDAFGKVPHDGVLVLNPVGNRVPNPNFLDSNSDGVANNLTLGAGFLGSISVDSKGIRWQRLTRPGNVVGANVSNTIEPFAITPNQKYSLACRVRWNTDGYRASVDGPSWTAVISVLFTDQNWGNYPNSSFLIFGTDGGDIEKGIILRDDLVAPAGSNRMLVNLFVVQNGVAAREGNPYIEFAELAVVQGQFALSGIDPDPEEPEEYPDALLDSDGLYITDSNDLPLES